MKSSDLGIRVFQVSKQGCLVDWGCHHSFSVRYFLLEQRLKYIRTDPKETFACIPVAKINTSAKIALLKNLHRFSLCR